MKKITSFLLVFLFLIGCKKDESINVQTDYKLVDFVFKSLVPSQTNTFKIEIYFDYNGQNYTIVDGAYINLRDTVYQLYREVPYGSTIRYRFSEFTENVTVESYVERVLVLPPTNLNSTMFEFRGSFIVR